MAGFFAATLPPFFIVAEEENGDGEPTAEAIEFVVLITLLGIGVDAVCVVEDGVKPIPPNGFTPDGDEGDELDGAVDGIPVGEPAFVAEFCKF